MRGMRLESEWSSGDKSGDDFLGVFCFCYLFGSDESWADNPNYITS